MTKKNVLKGALAVAGLIALAAPASAQKILVNEFYRDGSLGAGNEWVEVLLLEDMTAAELEAFYVGDSTSSTAAKFSSYKFTAMAGIAANFNAGTLITLTGSSGLTEDLAYNPGGGDWNLTIQTANATYITNNGSSGDLAGTDVVYVDTDGTNGNATISADGFAVNWDSTPGVFGGVANVLIAVPANVTAAALMSDLAGATTPANWTTGIAPASATPGLQNGGTNTTYIDGLRALLGPACTADTITVDSVVDGGDVSYHVATNSAAGIDTNDSGTQCSFGPSSCSTRIRGGDDDDYLYVFVDGSIGFFNKIGILIDSDGNTATGVVGDFPNGVSGPSNGIELFSEVAGGGWDTMLVIGRNGVDAADGGDGGNQSFVDIVTWTDVDTIEGEQFLGSGTAAAGSLCGTVRGFTGTLNYAMNYAGTPDNGIEVAIPRAWLSNSGIDCTGGYRLAAINGNGGFDFFSNSTIPQNATVGNIGNTGPIMAMAGLTAPAFDYNSDGAVSLNTVPAVAVNNGKAVNEGDTGVVIATADLEVSDVEEAAGAITYTLTAVPANGTLYNNAVALNVSDMFTQADVNGNLITYDHDGTETASDSFAANYTDGVTCTTQGTTFNITVTNTNDVPTVDGMADLAFTVAELGTYVLTTGDVNLADEEDGAAALTFEVSSLPANGTLNDTSRAVLMVGSTFTLQQLASGEISYTNTALGGGSDSFQLIYRDSTGPNQPAITVNATITASVNDWSILND